MIDQKTSVEEHLRELRYRVLCCIVFFFVLVFVFLPLTPSIVRRVKDDVVGDYLLVMVSPLEGVVVELWVSAFIGLFAGMPFCLYHIWRFVSPGLRSEERRVFLYMVVPSVFLFYAGCLFAYLFVLPVVFRLLMESGKQLAVPMLSLGETFSFILALELLFGLCFQMPLLLAGLSKAGIISHKTLAERRRYVVVAVFLVAGVLTPDPSPVTQILVAVPVYLLYEAGVFLASFFSK